MEFLPSFWREVPSLTKILPAWLATCIPEMDTSRPVAKLGIFCRTTWDALQCQTLPIQPAYLRAKLRWSHFGKLSEQGLVCGACSGCRQFQARCFRASHLSSVRGWWAYLEAWKCTPKCQRNWDSSPLHVVIGLLPYVSWKRSRIIFCTKDSEK